jgi:hypothetical protein
MTTSPDGYTPLRLVRLLLNDVDPHEPVFTNDEIMAFLALERGSVKRAAALAIDTNASNEALASKVLKTQDLSTDGAKVADALRAHAKALRASADRDDALDDTNAGWFEVVPDPAQAAHARPELTEHPFHAGWLI